MAMIPSLVDKDELFLANSLVSVTSMIAAVLGCWSGRRDCGEVGVESGFIIDASTFFPFFAADLFYARQRRQCVYTERYPGTGQGSD